MHTSGSVLFVPCVLPQCFLFLILFPSFASICIFHFYNVLRFVWLVGLTKFFAYYILFVNSSSFFLKCIHPFHFTRLRSVLLGIGFTSSSTCTNSLRILPLLVIRLSPLKYSFQLDPRRLRLREILRPKSLVIMIIRSNEFVQLGTCLEGVMFICITQHVASLKIVSS